MLMKSDVMMKIVFCSISTILILSSLTGCTLSKTALPKADVALGQPVRTCRVNPDIQRNQIPETPNNMSLPDFGQGIIGWATGPEGAQSRLESVSKADLPTFKEKGVTLEMVEEWQAFYENEVKRNPCNPTAPYRAQLMKKIADLWVQ